MIGDTGHISARVLDADYRRKLRKPRNSFGFDIGHRPCRYIVQHDGQVVLLRHMFKVRVYTLLIGTVVIWRNYEPGSGPAFL